MENVNAVRQYMMTVTREREELINGFLVALISQEPLVIKAPPGTGKSYMAEHFYKCLDHGSDSFSWLLTKYTTPDEVFGPLSLPEFQKGNLVRVLDGKAAKAKSIFLDEVFKANSAMLNALLGLLNERRFEGNLCPWEVMLAASNEYPSGIEPGTKSEGDSLEALFDRFTLKYHVDYLRNNSSKKDLIQRKLNWPTGESIPQITMEEISELRKAAANMVVPENILDKYLDIISSIEMKSSGSFTVSDRAMVKGMNVVRANAALNGHSEVKASDLNIIRYVFHNGSNYNDVASIVEQECYVELRLANDARKNLAELVTKIVKIKDNAASGHGIPDVELHNILIEATKSYELLVDFAKENEEIIPIRDISKDMMSSIRRHVGEIMQMM